MSTEPNTLPFEYQIRADAAQKDPKGAATDNEIRDRQLEDYLAKLQAQVNAGGGGGGGTLKVAFGAASNDFATGLPFVADTPGTPQNVNPDWDSAGLYDPSNIYDAGTNTFNVPAGSACQISIYYSSFMLPSPTLSLPGDYIEGFDAGGTGIDFVDFLPSGLNSSMRGDGLYRDGRSIGLISGGAHSARIITLTQGWTLGQVIYSVLWS